MGDIKDTTNDQRLYNDGNGKIDKICNNASSNNNFH